MRNLRVGTAIVSCFLRCRPVGCGVVRAAMAKPGRTRLRPARPILGGALVALAAFGTSPLRSNTYFQAHAQTVASAASSPGASSAASSSTNSSAPSVAAAAAPPAAATPPPTANVNPNGPDQELGQLFQMATELKTEVAKTNQEMLSIAVVRKAAAIEQLAHKVRTTGSTK